MMLEILTQRRNDFSKMFKYLLNVTIKNRNITTEPKPKGTAKEKLSYQNYMKLNKYRKILMKNFGSKITNVSSILTKHQFIFNIPEEDLNTACKLCLKLNIDVTSLPTNPRLLGLPWYKLEHRVELLRELGLNEIHAIQISKFYKIMRMKVRTFKAYCGVSKSKNLTETLMEYLGTLPPGVQPLETLNEDLSLHDFTSECLKWYIKWRLEVPEDDVQRINEIMIRMRWRSFRMMKRQFDIYHYDIGLTIQQIRDYHCLGFGTADNIDNIIRKIQKIGDVDIKKLMRSNPELHQINYDNAKAVIGILKRYGFTNEAMSRYAITLLINKTKLETRLQKLETVPELSVMKDNERVLLLINRFVKAEMRLNYLRYLDMKYPTLRSLTGQPHNFERFVKTGVDKSKAKEIGSSFTKVLNLEPKEIERKIQRHPYWRHVDLVSMHDTLKFLMKRFDLEAINENLQLILYPKEKLEEALNKLPELNEKSEDRKYSSKEILALCQYYIEQEFHFTGDGVWKNDSSMPRKLRLTDLTETESLDFSDSENTESEEGDESSKEMSSTDVDET